MTAFPKTGAELSLRAKRSNPLPFITGTTTRRPLRALWGDAHELVLMQHVIQREFVVLLDLVDADHLARDVAVFVEADLALQRLNLAGLDRIADVDPVHLLTRFSDPFDRIENDQRRVICCQRVVLRLLVILFDETL